ncbi:MAG: D-2-hydroxyacid dehydrogenase family protein [Betaproteobacteria bacterium]|nr:D-2-hydroxyacid dehydrogenase family protein [Betaproteobacteria bacterium]
MTRCAILDDYQNVALKMADWSWTGVEVTVYDRHFDTEEAVRKAIDGFEIVVAMRERTPFTKAFMATLPKMKMLQTTGPRNPSIDLRGAEELGITVCGTVALPYPTAELTWALIFGLVRHIPHEDANIRKGGRWQTRVGVDLHGRTLGCLGLGTLGAQVAKVGQALGMKTIAWSNNLKTERCAELGVEYVSKDRLMTDSDILSIHTQLSRRTEGIIDRSEFEKMKRTAYLINTSRGFIVRESALVHALERGLIAGAGLDTYDIEPLPPDHPLRRLPNTVLTPHVGYVSQDNYRLWYGQMVENICAWMQGTVLRRMDPKKNVDRSL